MVLPNELDSRLDAHFPKTKIPTDKAGRRPVIWLRQALVTYTSKWERVAEAANRVTKANDSSREQAEADICRAIADGDIHVRAKLARHANGSQRSSSEIDGSHLHIPSQLTPHDLDWEQSRPVNPWRIRELSRHHSGLWHLEWLELFVTDVTQALLLSDKSNAVTGSGASTGRKKHAAPKRNAVRVALNALYPAGIPGQDALLNDRLVNQVINYLKANNLPLAHRDTILRAADRRK